jgi:hypothetical protein
MQTLNFSNDTLDQDNTFVIDWAGVRRQRRLVAKLHKGYQKDDDGIVWAMQKSLCLKSEYTAKDVEERARLNAMEPVRNGDIVMIEGQQYKARVMGDFSDCAIFDPVN